MSLNKNLLSATIFAVFFENMIYLWIDPENQTLTPRDLNKYIC